MCRLLCGHSFQLLWVNARECSWFCKKLPNCILKWLCFAFPPAKDENSCCSTSLPTFGAVSVLNFGYSDRCIVISHCFNLYCPIDRWSGTPFHILICYLYIFFGEVFVQILCPFLIGLFIFLLLKGHCHVFLHLREDTWAWGCCSFFIQYCHPFFLKENLV